MTTFLTARAANRADELQGKIILIHSEVLGEVEHDSQIYCAYLNEAERIEKGGGTNLRVELDFELKSKVQKAIHAAQKTHPSRGIDEIEREVAEQHEPPYVRNKIEIPDTVTGISATLGPHSSPRSNARHHLNTWFAFTPCPRATSATLALGFNVNCTI